VQEWKYKMTGRRWFEGFAGGERLLKRGFMKEMWAVVVLVGGIGVGFGQDVFVLGGPGTTPVPPIIYQPPVVADGAASYQPAVAAVPVYAMPVYPAASSCASTYYNPNVIYVGGPGSCGPNYYRYPRYSTPNVIYFGREQAYREGYNFGHCR
jgi:hypothetical protein